MSSSRLQFVDAARAVAVLMMIQGHAVSVLLAPEYQASQAAHAWLFVRGLTSCTFFLLAGFSFAVATARRWDAYRAPTWRLFRRLARYAALFVFGYALHLPNSSVVDLVSGTPEQWKAFIGVDVLQLIAVTMLLLQVAVWLVRSPDALGRVALGATAAVVLATPVAWDTAGIVPVPDVVAAYLSGTDGSLFPLFPWAAYAFAGAAAGSWYIARGARAPQAFRPARVLAAGCGMIAAGAVLQAVPWSPYGGAHFWTVSPNLFLVKAGAVLAGLSAIIRLVAGRERLPGMVTALSRQSLLVYVAHLMVLYHPQFGGEAVQGSALRLGPGGTAAVALGLMAAMALLAWAVHQRRRYLATMLGWAGAHHAVRSGGNTVPAVR